VIVSLKLALTIDVEEEGLFSKEYEPRNVPVRNVPELNRLDAMFRELDIRPTLLVTYQVVRHEPYRELLLRLRDRWCGEIGAHLHPWNTPPLMSLPHPEPVPSELMPLSLLRAKIQTLFDALGSMGVTPASFRMGRFNLGPKVFSILELTSIRVDSSIAPMRKYYGGPDHIAAPVDPYFPNPADPRTMGGAGIEFFFPKPMQEMDARTIHELFKKRNALAITAQYPQETVSDVAWGQIKKTEKKIKIFLEQSDFEVKRIEGFTDEKNSVAWIMELVELELPKTQFRMGPPAEDKKNVERFLKAHPHRKPRIQNGRIALEIPRTITSANKCLRLFLKQVSETKQPHVPESLRKTGKILAPGTVQAEAKKNNAFRRFATEFFGKKKRF